MTENKKYNEDTVAVWKIPLADGDHEIEFEHGTATGKRIIRLDGKIVRQKDWMFQLVGDEIFDVDNVQCTIKVEPDGLFMYTYSLLVDGKSLEEFSEHVSKTRCTWLVTTEDGIENRIVLDKASMDIVVNGFPVTDAMSEFIENGTETHFAIGNILVTIRTEHTCDKKTGVVHNLFANGNLVPEL